MIGLYLLYPNYIERLSRISNASYAVDTNCCRKHIEEKLVLDSLKQVKSADLVFCSLMLLLKIIFTQDTDMKWSCLYRNDTEGILHEGYLQNICLYYHEL